MVLSFVSIAPRALIDIPRHSTLPVISHDPNTPPSLVLSASQVKIFDASQLTDTVVVSNSFWNSLSSKLPTLLLAELLASVAFVAIASILIAQGKFLLDVVTSPDNNNNDNNSSIK